MVGLFVQWLYLDAPRAHTVFFRDLMSALFSYFSIPLLTQTLLDPWRHDAVDMSRLPIAYWGRAFMDNFVSRLIGFFLRFGVIVSGLIVMGVTFVFAAVYTVLWYLLPFILLASIFYGFSMIIGGSNG